MVPDTADAGIDLILLATMIMARCGLVGTMVPDTTEDGIDLILLSTMITAVFGPVETGKIAS